MRRIFVVLLILFVIVPRVFAQALPVTPMQNAVSGVMQQTMIKRGFAANDPRFGATLSKASSVLGGVAGTAAAVTVGAVTAPGWASIALAAGIGAVITYAVTIGVDALSNWLFRTDGKLDTLGSSLNSPAAVSIGGAYWYGSLLVGPGSTNISIYGGDGRAMAYQSEVNARVYLGLSTSNLTCNLIENSSNTYWACGSYGSPMYYRSSGAPYSCAHGMYCTATNSFSSPVLNSPSKTAVSLQTAINDLPASDKTKPLNPAIVAALADQAWKNAAAQPGYDGLPYVASNPITAPDAAKWQQANPQSWPSVSDFVKPQPAPTGGTSASPYVLPNTSTPVSSYNPATQSQSTSTNPASSNTLQNLGPDPGIGSPSLEATPTAQSILAPILGLLPDLRSFSAPSQSGVCPKPTIDLWNQHLVLDGHCALLDNNAGAIQAVMALVWVLIAMFIILAA